MSISLANPYKNSVLYKDLSIKMNNKIYKIYKNYNVLDEIIIIYDDVSKKKKKKKKKFKKIKNNQLILLIKI